jgi:hypothetical protein
VELDRQDVPRAEIRYARNGGVALAYQVVGEGEVDLVHAASGRSVRLLSKCVAVAFGRKCDTLPLN